MNNGQPPQTFLHKVAAAPVHDDAIQEEAAQEDAAREGTVRENPVQAARADAAGDEAPEAGAGHDPYEDTAPIAGGPEQAGEPAEVRASQIGPDQGRHAEPAASMDGDQPAGPVRSAVPPQEASPSADGSLLGDAGDELMTRWRQAAGSFVDDPGAAVAAATDVISDAVARMQAAIRERQLGADGHGQPDTEALRQAMLGYRRLLDGLLS